MGLKEFFVNLFDGDQDDDEFEDVQFEENRASPTEPQSKDYSQTNKQTVSNQSQAVTNQQTTKEQNKPMANDANRSKVVNLGESRKNVATVEIFKPRIFAEAERISQSLLANKSVVLNLAQMSDEDARRFVDYITGVVYAIDGDLQRVATDVFLAVPESVHIEGLYEEYTNAHNKSTRERGNIWEREGEIRE